MSTPQFIPVIFSNMNLANGSAPFLGHTGWITVDASGVATYYEYGTYPASDTHLIAVNQTTLDPNRGSRGDIRSLDLGTVNFDDSGNLTSASLRTVLDKIVNPANGLYPTDPGMLFVSPIALTPAQFAVTQTAITNLENGIKNGTAPDYSFVGPLANPVGGNNCFTTPVFIANQAGFNIGINSILSLDPVPSQGAVDMALILGGYQYTGPNSALGSNFIRINPGDSYFTSLQQQDAQNQFWAAAGNDAGALGSWILENVPIPPSVNMTLSTVEHLGGLLKLVFETPDKYTMTETLGGGATPTAITFTNPSGALLAGLSLNADGSSLLSIGSFNGESLGTLTKSDGSFDVLVNGQTVLSAPSGTTSALVGNNIVFDLPDFGIVPFTIGNETLGLSGIAQISTASTVGAFTLTDVDGRQYTLSPASDATGNYQLKSISSGAVDVTLSPGALSSLDFGASLSFTNNLGDSYVVNASTGAGQIFYDDTAGQTLSSGAVEIDYNTLRAGTANGLGTDYDFTPTGAAASTRTSFFGLPDGLTFGNEQTAESNLKTTLPTADSAVQIVGGVTQTIQTIEVINLNGGGTQNGGNNSDALSSGAVEFGDVIVGPGVLVQTGDDTAIVGGLGVDSLANTDGLVPETMVAVITGGYRPGNEQLQDISQNGADLVGGLLTGGSLAGGGLLDSGAVQVTSNPTLDQVLAGYAAGAPDLIDIDPLLIDIAGKGISVNNWVGNNIFFDTNVTADGTAADDMQHHTSWMANGTGMLVFDPTGGTVTDITQTISEFLNVGFGVGVAPPGSAGPQITDGLSALANLVDPAFADQGVFSAATSAIDPNTGNSYWSEIKVAQGTPDASGAINPSQMQTLDALGITSISLNGSGNQGESLNGSPVTNRATYTFTASDGSTGVGGVAAVNFATDTTGDIVVQQDGSVIINSTPEGGASAASSYIDEHTSAQTLVLNNGVLTDNGVTVQQQMDQNGDPEAYDAVFATTQNDIISVNSADTHNYWLGGGTGAATLTGGAGNTTFLINAQTIVHADFTGHNFNIAQVVGSAPITVDLGTDKLQEVIGGVGDGTFNASGATWDVYIQGGSGNNIIIGGRANSALAGGSGDDLIEAGPGGSVIHAGSGNDVIYGGSGITANHLPNSDVIYGGAGHDTVVLGTNNTAVYAGSGSMTIVGNSNLTVPVSNLPAFSVIMFHGSYADYTLTHNADGSITITDSVAGRDGPVTLKNVNAIGFSDISQIPLSSLNVLPVNDTVTVSGSGPYVIQASTLLANDIDYAAGTHTLSIKSLLGNDGSVIARGSSGAVNGGTAALSNDGATITFTPTPGFGGLPSFRYLAQDSAGNQDLPVQQIDDDGTTNGPSGVMNGTVTLLRDTLPSDPGLPQEWYLQAADILPAWEAGYTGAGVSVGVFDLSGNVDFSNPDLTANAGGEFLDDGTPGIDQVGAHATLVAGVIGAASDGEGEVGVAYSATIGSEAATSGLDTAHLADSSLNDWTKYDVVNNSWGDFPPYFDSFEYPNNMELPFQQAAQQGRDGLGTVIVFAGGNSRGVGGDTNQSELTANQYEITVGGIDATGDIGSLQIVGTPFSNPGASILVSAPANDINTTGVAVTNEFGQDFGSLTQAAAGTSMSAPIVSGVVALMLEANPNLGARDVQEILADTATFVPSTTAAPTSWSFNGATTWNGGGMEESNDYGFGEVDAAAAVRLAKTWSQDDTFTNESSVSIQRFTGGSIYTFQTPNDFEETGDPADTLATKSVGYTSTANGLIIPASGSPYIDFNVAALGDDTISVEHITVSLEVDFTGLAGATEAEAVANANQAALDLNNLQVTLSDGTTSSVLKSVIPASVFSANPDMEPALEIGQFGDGEFMPFFQFDFDTVRDWNESDQQDFHLTVVNAAGTPLDGVISSAALTVNGDVETAGQGQTHIYTDAFGSVSSLVNDTSRATLSDTGTGVVLNAAAVSTGTTLDLNAGSTDSLIAGRALAIASGTTVTTAFGGNGNDLFIANDAGDTLVGGNGNNTVSFASVAGTVSANLQTGVITNAAGHSYTLTNIENLTGSAGDDNLTGDADNNVLDGDAGDDILSGNGGSDTYVVGPGEGTVTIENGLASNTAPTGTLKFTGSIDQLTFAQSGDDLVIMAPGTGTAVTVQGWFTASWAQVANLMLPNGTVLTNAEINQLITDGTPIIGAGANAEGQDGPDAFVKLANGALEAIEGNGAAATFTGLSIVPGMAALGTGTNFEGHNGKDIFFQSTGGQSLNGAAAGQLEVAEYNGSTLIAEYGITNPNGTALGVATGMLVSGTGVNFGHTGNRDVFIQTAAGSGQIFAAETSPVGTITWAQALTGIGGAGTYTIDSTSTIIGTGEAFLSGDGSDIFIQEANGQLVAAEFNGGGNLVRQASLANGAGGFLVDAATTVVGNAVNYFGYGGFDLFLKLSSGQIAADEFTNNTLHYSTALTNTVGGAFGFDNGDQMVGATATTNFLGTPGGQAGAGVFVRLDDGSLGVWQFNLSTGQMEAGATLKQNASTNFSIPVGARVIGTGQFTASEHDAFIELASGQLYVARFDSNWTEIFSATGLTSGYIYLNGTPMVVDQYSIVLAAGISGTHDQIALSQAGGAYITYNITTTQAVLHAAMALPQGGGAVPPTNPNVNVSPASGLSTITESDGSETVIGTDGNDVFTPSGGVSTLVGNGGSDIYQFGSGSGIVAVQNGLAGANTAAGEVDFGPGITKDNLWFEKSGNNLIVDILGDSGDRLTIDGWFADGSVSAQLGQFVDANSQRLSTNVNSLVQAMAAYAANNPGFSSATATQMPADTALQNALAASWHA